jgi:hypothetical protein
MKDFKEFIIMAAPFIGLMLGGYIWMILDIFYNQPSILN